MMRTVWTALLLAGLLLGAFVTAAGIGPRCGSSSTPRKSGESVVSGPPGVGYETHV